MIALTALMVSSIAFAQDREYVIVVHGGAAAMAAVSYTHLTLPTKRIV